MSIKDIEQLKYGSFPSSNVYKAKIKRGSDWYKDKVGEVVEIVRFGSMGCYTKDFRYIDFYDLEFE